MIEQFLTQGAAALRGNESEGRQANVKASGLNSAYEIASEKSIGHTFSPFKDDICFTAKFECNAPTTHQMTEVMTILKKNLISLSSTKKPKTVVNFLILEL